MTIASSIPKGFSSSDAIIFPSKSNETARVAPQEGQEYPVTFLIKQTRNVSFGK